MTEVAYLLIRVGKGPGVVVVCYEALTGIGRKGQNCDFACQLARRGFVARSLDSPPATCYVEKNTCQLQPLSNHAHVAVNSLSGRFGP